jgi:hypothetical protein
MEHQKVRTNMLNRIKKELTEPGEVEHEYVELDLIRLVYEDGELIGWYRPGDAEDAEEAEQTESVQNGTDGAHRSEAEVL